ncbi:hypothetical protein ABT127_34795 [Streptomyces sp. NPDC001904]|uniref:type II secretion system F family protein n=1 Tax=Streptomyces sp. NPDC001904 TaxID=3154531 RepID=UPI00332F3689
MSVPTMIVCGAVAGGGVALLVRELVPSAPKLGPALRRLDPPAPAPGARVPKAPSLVWAQQWVERMPGRLPRTDLELLRKSPEQFLVNKVSLALMGLFSPLVVVFGWMLMGLSVSVFIPGLAGVAAAVALWFVPDYLTASEARRARIEFEYAAAAWIDLVAIRLASNVAPSQALEDAARIGRGWAFALIQEALLRSRTEKTSPWQALDDMGERLRLPVLQDVADIMRLSSDDGASIYDTLRNRGKAQSGELMARESARAHADSEKLSVPGALLAVIAMFLIAFPAVLSIFTI